MQASNISYLVHVLTIKWFLDLSWVPTVTEKKKEILAVYKAAVFTKLNAKKISRLVWQYLQTQFYQLVLEIIFYMCEIKTTNFT